MLLIKNGRVVDPVSGVDEVKDVLVNEGNIVMTGTQASEMFYDVQRKLSESENVQENSELFKSAGAAIKMFNSLDAQTRGMLSNMLMSLRGEISRARKKK